MQRKRSWRIPKLFRQCVYVPPNAASATSPNLFETAEEIQLELQKRENLLSQIHSEMNAGSVSKKREDELWETQRIITQLKRKLRTFENKRDSVHKRKADTDANEESIDFTLQRPEKEEKQCDENIAIAEVAVEQPKENDDDSSEKISMTENGLYMLPKTHPDYATLLKLQLENQELLDWKQELQSRINAERAECVRLKTLLDSQEPSNVGNDSEIFHADDSEYERLIDYYIKENSLLEQKRMLLAKEIFNENLQLIQLQVDLDMKQYIH